RLLPRLLSEAHARNGGIALQFSGQGNSFLLELRKLHRTHAGLAEFFETCAEAIDEVLARTDVRSSPYLDQGFALQKWLRKEEVPSGEYLHRCTISLPATEIAQLAYYHTLLEEGYEEGDLLDQVVGLTGHSQGI